MNREYDGYDLLVLGFIAGKETKKRLKEDRAALLKTLSARYLEKADALAYDAGDPLPEAVSAAAELLFPMGEGGIFRALWEFGEQYQTGMAVKLKEIPVRQETIEVCEALEIHPYEADSAGSYLAAVKNGLLFQEICEKNQVPARVIGRLKAQNARTIENGDGLRYLDKPREAKTGLPQTNL